MEAQGCHGVIIRLGGLMGEGIVLEQVHGRVVRAGESLTGDVTGAIGTCLLKWPVGNHMESHCPRLSAAKFQLISLSSTAVT